MNSMRRIIIVGSSGSGKSTLAMRLSAVLSIPHIEIDALHWKPNWVESSTDELRRKVDAATRDGPWVMSGNYLQIKDLTWTRADTIVFLDYPMSIVFPRVVWRTFWRWWNKELLWGTNRETLAKQFLTTDSILLWVINTWRKYRRDLPKRLCEAKAQGKTALRFRTSEQALRWVRTLVQETLRPPFDTKPKRTS